MSSEALEMKIKTLETKFRRRHKLNLEGYEHNNKLSLKEFIKEFIVNLNYRYNTRYVKSKGKQCEWGKRRSTGDIFMICRSYYPDVTLKEVMTIIAELGQELDIIVTYCPTIKKRVFYKNHYPRMAGFVGSWFANPEEYSRRSYLSEGDENKLNGEDYLSLIKK